MNYRIVRITNLYKEYIDQYYRVHPNLNEKSYEDQHDHLVNNSLDIVSSVSKGFLKKGIEAFIIFTNADELQAKWKEEHKSSKSDTELIIDQVKSLEPMVVWIDDMTLVNESWILALRESVPSLRLVTGHICAPYTSKHLKNIKALDFLFTCTPCLQKEFETNGIISYLVYHSFEKEILEKISLDNKYPDIELLFTGSLYTGGGFHKTRIEYLEQMLAAGLPLTLYGKTDSSALILSKLIAYYTIKGMRGIGLGDLTKHLPVIKNYLSYGGTPVKFYSKKLVNSMRPAVYGIEQFKILSKAGICFNIHGEIAKSCAGNLRLFEATGAGACLVTDWKENIYELFEPDKEIVTYRSIEECIDKIQWLLVNPDERIKIAKAGQKRTLQDHTVEKRVEAIDKIIQEHL